MKRKNKIVAILLLLVVLCIFFAACEKKQEEPDGIVMTDLTPVCAGRTSKTVSNTKITVNYCDCNALGVILNGSGSTSSLSRHTLAKIPDTVYASFDALGAAYAAFLADYEVPEKATGYAVKNGDKFGAVCDRASAVFSASDFPICKKVKYNTAKSAVVGVNKPFCISDDSAYDYGSMLFLVSELFGYKSSDTFKSYAHNLVAAYGNNEASDVAAKRTRLDGAVYTENGSYILPYVFSSDLSSYFVAFVVMDVNGVISVWVSNIESVAYAVDYSQKATDAKNVSVYGRCTLFETASGYYRFSLKGDLPAGKYAEMTIETDDKQQKTVTIMLLPQYAPKSVENFIAYAEEGFYDETVIHRIVPNGCLQGGGYTYVKGSGYNAKTGKRQAIEGEFTINKHPENVIGHCPGVISMARATDVNSATSEFFLCFDYYPSWDGAYAGFGFMPYQEDIDFIANLGATTKTSSSDYPISRVITIKKVKIVEKTDGQEQTERQEQAQRSEQND